MIDIKIKKFKVIPAVPEKLSILFDIAYNLWLYWNPDVIKLFIRMDADLWDKTRHNPIKMLGEISQERLDELANDEGYVLEARRINENLTEYLKNINAKTNSPSIGYFSLEFGLTEVLPIYSGGLGILAGDHIKSSSDIGLKLVGVGLLYQRGYFRQYLNQDGWQQDFYDINDFYNMPITELKNPDGSPLGIELKLPGRILYLKAWKLSVGRVSIYLLDSNVPPNSHYDRELTAQLYGGDRELRLQQEIILGIGGITLLDKLNIHPDVIHMNEGHSSFAFFERARLLMKKNALSFAEAQEIIRKSSVFTTHTPVPAGNDEFSPDLIRKYFQGYAGELGMSSDEFLSLGRINPSNSNENFSMPVLAIKHSSYINGVSKLHRIVSQKMWKNLWSDVPEEHIPIQSVTNGVHLASWISFEMNELFRRYLGENWQEKQDKKELWERIQKIPDMELWRVHCARRRRLIYFIRSRLIRQLREKGASESAIGNAEEALNPETLTIGFARRFASYKRGDLLFKDLQRLMKLVDDPLKPVQFIFAGKAHPQDNPGKEIIKHIIHSINDNHLIKQIVFIEDYDMDIARYMAQGVDLWLNNPLRPQEASGTSGMKVAVNGGLNLSILDGWWDEAFNIATPNGWAIGSGESYENRLQQDEVESKAIYSIIENDIVPMFYDMIPDGLPRQWIRRMKNAFISIVSYFNTHRMVKEYNEKFYLNAARHFQTLSGDNFKLTRQLTQWKSEISKQFYNIRAEDVSFKEEKTYKINDKIDVYVDIFTGSIKPEEIKVDLYYGHVAHDHFLSETSIENLSTITPIGNGKYRFSGSLPCLKTGNFGYKVRITPFHPLMIDPYELNLVIWI